MTDEQVNEAYFRALGYVKENNSWCILKHHERQNYTECVENIGESLPNITQDFPAFKKYVLEKMEGKGYEPRIIKKKIGGLYFVWEPIWGKTGPVEALIKGNEILRAAVIGSTRYWESKG